jgi:hypothetical protein
MTTTTDLVLLTTDAEGRSRLGSAADAVVGGAVLVDLLEAGRLRLEGERPRRARVHVVDPARVADAVTEAAFARVRGGRPLRPASMVTRLGKGARKAQYDALVASGVVSRRREKVWGLFPVTRHHVVDTAPRNALRDGVRAVLLDGAHPDARTGPVIGLLHAASLLRTVVDKPELKSAKRRAAEVSAGDWASKAVKDAIAASQAAVLAATTAGVAAAAGSS